MPVDDLWPLRITTTSSTHHVFYFDLESSRDWFVADVVKRDNFIVTADGYEE
jgi:hypothetical protein